MGSQLQEDRQFFTHYFVQQNSQLQPGLQLRYQSYRRPSYAHKKPSVDIGYLRKYRRACQVLVFAGSAAPIKLQIGTVEAIVREVYEDYLVFLVGGGWRCVKNKSAESHLQEYLLVKLARLFPDHRKQLLSLDSFVLAFFYTLNYLKTCNYEIKLFAQLLASNNLEYLFLFELFFHNSRRAQRDLVVTCQQVTRIVNVLKTQTVANSRLSSKNAVPQKSIEDHDHSKVAISIVKQEAQHSQQEQKYEEMPQYGKEFIGLPYWQQGQVKLSGQKQGQVKLVLIYGQIVEYVQRNRIVLHQIMIFNLMRAAGLISDTLVDSRGPVNWKQFFAQYFDQLLRHKGNSFEAVLLRQAIDLNMKLADNIFGQPIESSRQTYSEGQYDLQRQGYLQQSFGILVGQLQGMMRGGQDQNKWRRLFEQARLLFESGIDISKSIVSRILRDNNFYQIYRKYKKYP